VRKGAKHGWVGLERDVAHFADWFDKHLAKKGNGRAAAP